MNHMRAEEIEFLPTLFGTYDRPSSWPFGFFYSATMHGACICFAVFGIQYDRFESERPRISEYNLRILRFRPPEPRRIIREPEKSAARHNIGGSHTTNESRDALEPAPEGERPFELPPEREKRAAVPTIIQPDTPEVVWKEDLRVPAVVIWNRVDVPKLPLRKFSAPELKERMAPSVSLPAPPVLDSPNAETKVSDLRFTAAMIPESALLVRHPSTTSPIQISGIEEAKRMPDSALEQDRQGAANLISVPESAFRTSLAMVPAANQIAPVRPAGTPSDSTNGSGAGSQNKGTGNASAQGSGNGRSSGQAAGGPANGTSGPGAGQADDGGREDAGASGKLRRIVKPSTGRFSAVVLGSSAADAYPETQSLLTGKIVYTVYVQVGLRKSWILQYWLAKPGQPNVVAKGSATSIDAPWPFLILRPEFPNALEPDYVIIRGQITAAGHFEKLVLLLPKELTHGAVLLSSLDKWQFRPAARDGQPIDVDILLIIPKEPAE